jgi:hypothetical protein
MILTEKHRDLFSITFGTKTEIPVKSSFTGIAKGIKQENKIYNLNPIVATIFPALFFK